MTFWNKKEIKAAIRGIRKEEKFVRIDPRERVSHGTHFLGLSNTNAAQPDTKIRKGGQE